MGTFIVLNRQTFLKVCGMIAIRSFILLYGMSLLETVIVITILSPNFRMCTLSRKETMHTASSIVP